MKKYIIQILVVLFILTIQPLVYAKNPIVTYFIYSPCTNLVKIGKTSVSVEHRKKQLETGSGCELQILLIINEDLEKILHKKFHEYKIYKEWYTYSNEIKSFIKSYLVLTKNE